MASKNATPVEPSIQKLFYRPSKGRAVAGVCLSLANYFNIDLGLVRIIMLLLVPSGSAIAIYMVLWLLTPSEEMKTATFGNSDVIKANGKEIETWFNAKSSIIESKANHNRIRFILGIFVVGLGIFLLLQNMGFLDWFRFAYLWPLILIGIGITLLTKNNER